jgi:fructose-bisphosphate aldolase class I
LAITDDKAERVFGGAGFFAALDQSGGSTPKALEHYGIPAGAWRTEAEMFALMHEMRVRIMTAPAFSSTSILGAILFEGTMDGEAEGLPVPQFLWARRGIVPFVKIDKGLEEEQAGVQLMKPIPGLSDLLKRAAGLGVFGTKARSVIRDASQGGVEPIVAQQFEFAEQVLSHGLVPIVEPEVLIKSPDKREAETILRDVLTRYADDLPEGRRVILKLTPPEEPDHYRNLVEHPRVGRVVALSGGYSRDEACRRVAANHGVIASFSRALMGDLRKDMSEAEFDATLQAAVDQIAKASIEKT